MPGPVYAMANNRIEEERGIVIGCFIAVFELEFLAFLMWKHLRLTGDLTPSRPHLTTGPTFYPREIEFCIAGFVVSVLFVTLLTLATSRLQRGPENASMMDRIGSIRVIGPVALVVGLVLTSAVALWSLLNEVFRRIVGPVTYLPFDWWDIGGPIVILIVALILAAPIYWLAGRLKRSE